MKFFFVFIIMNWFAFGEGIQPSPALPPKSLVKVPSGSIAPFWLESIKVDVKNKKKTAPPKIQVSAFEVMPSQVTVKEFTNFLKENPRWEKENVSSIFVDNGYLQNLKLEKLDGDAPMTSVSWFAAKAYCESLKMRLPTTNEWEYMAAASENKKDATKDSVFLERILNWYGSPQNGNLKPIRSVYKNIYGIWDLHGLVWEWVADFNSNFITGESREDSSLNKDMFCGAGGQAGGNKENYAAFMRYAFRSSLKGTSSVWNLGFRCVR